ncbi:MAG: DNA repair protein RecO [Desulfobacterales bacterium]|nr:MAG: DNA repair protein RecO [Desulfobacterales bacterium]
MDRSDFSTDAILLRKVEYGDHDLILTFLTRDRGKICTIAKNAKKSVRRFSGALDLFSANHIHCTFPKKNRDGLIILTQTSLDNGFVNIRYDVAKTGYACYWMEIITLWLEEGKPQPALFELLYSALGMLDRSEVNTAVAGLLFQIRFMSLSGFSPTLKACDTCNTGLDQIPAKRVWFDFHEGRVICPACRRNQRFSKGHLTGPDTGMMVSKGTLKQLDWMNQNDMTRADRMKFSTSAIREGEILLEWFVPFHLGRQFKSLGFLQRMRRER